MPWRPARLCACGRPSRARGRCERCAAGHEQQRYGSEPWRRWYHLTRWRLLRETQLRAHPFCQCPACDEGRHMLAVATTVDHRRPHRGDARLFWDPENLQSMTKACHDRKTQQESR